MRTPILWALVGTIPHLTSAAVHFPYAKQQKSSSPSTGSARRSVDTNLSYNGATYVVNVTVGTPGQAVSLELSTSSSDTWVMDARSPWCTDTYSDYDYETDAYNVNVVQYCIWGSFSPGNSSSCVLSDTSSSDDDDDYYYSDEGEFSASYNDGLNAYGDYMYDVLTIDGMAISNLTMGLVNETSSSLEGENFMGVLGIGFNDSSSDNLPDRLLEQGLINTTAYSIWMDDDTAASGSLLFGAIDTTKFTGNLTRLKSSYSYVDMMVQVVGINATTKEGGPIVITVDSDEESSTGQVDSETSGDSFLFTAVFSPPDTMSIVPSDVASQIWQIAGAYYNEDLNLALIGCSAASDSTTNFTIQLGGQGFDGPIITAYISDLVIPASEFNLSAEASYYVDPDDNACLFGVQNASTTSYSYSYSSQYNLGSTMLRRTYSVFDLVNSEVAVAPVVFGASATSNVVPFESYGATVPSSTVICYYSDCYTDGGNSESTASDDGASSSSGGLPGVLSLGALIGLTLGLAAGCFVLGLIGFLIWRHRRKTSVARKEAASVSSAEAGQPAPVMSTATAGHTRAPTPAAPAPAAPTAPTAPSRAAPAAPTPVDVAPVKGIDKGKGPGISPPLPPRNIKEEEPTTSSAEASTAHGPEHGEQA